MNNKQETIVGSAIQKFIDESLAELIDKDFIYNEFSLQHELGIYLREKLGKEYQIRFERNVIDEKWGENEDEKYWEKKEMDIFIEKDSGNKYAIELKFPQNGQYPEQMYSFIKDIKFMEQVREKANARTFVLTLVDDKNFYQETGREKKEKDNEKLIYWYFRQKKEGDKPIRQIEKNVVIPKPTGIKEKEISLANEYSIKWETIPDYESTSYRYYFFEIPQNN
jgi:hypothetical protein